MYWGGRKVTLRSIQREHSGVVGASSRMLKSAHPTVVITKYTQGMGIVMNYALVYG